MCLMCEWDYGHCTEPECVEKAKITDAQRRENDRSGFFESEYFRSNKGLYEYFLWRGYSEPCEHIIADHGPECNVVKPHKQSSTHVYAGKVYTWFGYDNCNCELIDDEWEYF